VSESSFAITGDLMIRTPGITARYERDAGFQAALQELHRSEVAVANLETPLSSRGEAVPKTFNLRADPAVMADVAALGLNAVTLANNHMMDYGPDALADTLAACQRAGLEVDANLLSEQPGTVPMVNSWAVAEDQARVEGMIAACREQGAAAVIVAIHWGSPSHWLSPYQGYLCAYQRPLAHALIDAGADAICGSHPHQLHPVEVYRGKPIFYSLGNFIYEGVAEHRFMEPEAIIVRLSFDEQPGCELIPLWLDEQGFPSLATVEAAERVFDKVRDLSRPYGTEIVMEDGIAMMALT
jgi:poly-gamma-glutamate capsule biosynthesis protein CapA/YwtB (metallophosphatase superfamily)